MIPIVYSDLSHKNVYIIWAHYFGAYGYHVYRRAVKSTTPWAKITASPIYVNFYKDTGVTKLSRYEYKITHIDSSGTETDLTTPAIPDAYQSPQRKVMGNVHKAIHQITAKSFDLGKAEYCQLLIKPHVGIPCSGCYDEYTKDVTEPWCTECYNTRIQGGYIYYANIPVRFGNQGQKLEATEQGYDLKESISVQVQDYPIIENEDIIIRATGQRYFIAGDVRKIQIQSLIVKQTASVREIFKEDGAYYYTL